MRGSRDGDAVFKALADPTRRALLDALFERDGQNMVELSEHVPDMTRFGVMKHLAVLEDAELVTTQRVGRTKLHFLNPVPIADLAHRWIAKYAEPFTNSLLGLRAELERPHAAAAPPRTATTQATTTTTRAATTPRTTTRRRSTR